MKALLLASALMIGGVAYAQADPRDAGQPIGSGNTMQPGTTMGERDTMGTNMPAAPTAQTGTTTDPATGTTVDPATGTTTGTMTDPVSGATTGTATMNTGDSTMSTTGTTMGTTGSGTMVVQQGGNMSPPPTTRDSYPRCSRTVTDNCVQDESRARDTRRTRR